MKGKKFRLFKIREKPFSCFDGNAKTGRRRVLFHCGLKSLKKTNFVLCPKHGKCLKTRNIYKFLFKGEIHVHDISCLTEKVNCSRRNGLVKSVCHSVVVAQLPTAARSWHYVASYFRLQLCAKRKMQQKRVVPSCTCCGLHGGGMFILRSCISQHSLSQGFQPFEQWIWHPKCAEDDGH